MTKLHDFNIRMFGTAPLYRHDVLGAVLSAFESDPLWAPSGYSTQERTELPYRRDEVLTIVKDQQPSWRDLFVRHGKPTKYEALLLPGVAPHLSVYFDPKLSAKHWAAAFALCEALVAAFRPDIATVHICYPWSHPPRTQDDLDIYLMALCADLIPARYHEEGPRGLGMRTYFGPHFIKQFGRPFLESTPAVVSEGPADTLRIDLEKDPWTLDVPAQLSAWRRAMAHLRLSPALATWKIKPSGLVDWQRGPACDVGGYVQ